MGTPKATSWRVRDIALAVVVLAFGCAAQGGTTPKAGTKTPKVAVKEAPSVATVEGVLLQLHVSGLNTSTTRHLDAWNLYPDKMEGVPYLRIEWNNSDNEPPPGLRSTMRVRITGVPQARVVEKPALDGGRGDDGEVQMEEVTYGSLLTSDVEVLAPAQDPVARARRASATKTAVTLPRPKVAILLADFSACNPSNPSSAGPHFSEFQAQRLFFEENAGNAASVERQFRACTYGGITFDPAFQRVFVVRVPSNRCTMRESTPWGFDFQYAWNNCPESMSAMYFADRMEELAIQQYGASVIAGFDYRWHILSKSQTGQSNCWWGGLASLGCGAYGPDRRNLCRIIMNPAIAGETYAWLHEGGHNLGFGHAGKRDQEYGDVSSNMGTYGDWPWDRCYNIVELDQLGVTEPQLVEDVNLIGRPTAFTIPASADQRNHGVRIRGTTNAWNTAEQNSATVPSRFDVLLSYRVQRHYMDFSRTPPARIPFQGDVSLDTVATGVLLHATPNPRNGAGSWPTIEGRAPAGAGQTVVTENDRDYTGLVVRVLEVSAGSVRVSVCRKAFANGVYAPADVCDSGRDDNCDGVINPQGCRAPVPSPSIPPPSPKIVPSPELPPPSPKIVPSPELPPPSPKIVPSPEIAPPSPEGPPPSPALCGNGQCNWRLGEDWKNCHADCCIQPGSNCGFNSICCSRTCVRAAGATTGKCA